MPTLFDPARFGDIALANRVVMAPLTRNRATNQTPHALHVEYYRQRAGAGLIITEATQIRPDGQGYFDTPGIHSPEQFLLTLGEHFVSSFPWVSGGRWEADQQTGFVTFEVATRRIRPADDSGQPIGSLLYDAATGDSQDTSPEVDKGLFAQVVALILRGYARAGKAPTTAHAYYY